MTQQQKAEIRLKILQRRDSLSLAEVSQYSGLIGQQILNEFFNSQKNSCYSVGLYSAIRNEVNTAKVFEILTARGIRCCFPRTNGQKLQFVFVENLSQLSEGAFGILEPQAALSHRGSEDLVPEVLLVPGIAFSTEGYRIGYGKGFYDKTLADWAARKLSPKLTIGLAFDFQILDDLPYSEFDFPVDVVVSENRMLRRNPA